MTPIKFPQANRTFAKDQPPYLPLPAHYREPLPARYADGSPEGEVISCWKLTWRERLKMLLVGKLWLSQWTFHDRLQPQRPSVDSPWLEAAREKESYRPHPMAPGTTSKA